MCHIDNFYGLGALYSIENSELIAKWITLPATIL